MGRANRAAYPPTSKATLSLSSSRQQMQAHSIGSTHRKYGTYWSVLIFSLLRRSCRIRKASPGDLAEPGSRPRIRRRSDVIWLLRASMTPHRAGDCPPEVFSALSDPSWASSGRTDELASALRSEVNVKIDQVRLPAPRAGSPRRTLCSNGRDGTFILLEDRQDHSQG